jgi:hypothetical protein
MLIAIVPNLDRVRQIERAPHRYWGSEQNKNIGNGLLRVFPVSRKLRPYFRLIRRLSVSRQRRGDRELLMRVEGTYLKGNQRHPSTN